MAIAAKPGDAYIDELEAIRDEWIANEGPRDRPKSREQGAEGRRRSLKSGSNNHAFTGEQYLNCPDKALRRIHLTKIMDESGQSNFGGPVPSHILLAEWEAQAYGVSQEEIDRLRNEDQTPENLVTGGWRIYTTRHDP